MNRNNGLDTLRAIAIIMVFLHNFWYADKNITFGFITKIGWVAQIYLYSMSIWLLTRL